jgi:Leucine-rich repeat (LRR) protein
VELPQEIGHLTNLRELHLQGNRLTVLPPQLGHLVSFLSSKVLIFFPKQTKLFVKQAKLNVFSIQQKIKEDSMIRPRSLKWLITMQLHLWM